MVHECVRTSIFQVQIILVIIIKEYISFPMIYFVCVSLYTFFLGERKYQKFHAEILNALLQLSSNSTTIFQENSENCCDWLQSPQIIIYLHLTSVK